jgi:hypothetical protein
LKIEIWEADPDKDLEDPENFQLTTLHVRYPQTLPRREASFTLEYTYQADGLLHVKATLDKSGLVLVDQEISDFTHGETLTIAEIKRQMTALGGLPQAAAPASLTPQFTVPIPQPPMPPSAGGGKSFVVDGSNLAWMGRDAKVGDSPSFAQLLEAVEALRTQYPGCKVDVIVDAALVHQLAFLEREELRKGMRSGLVTQVPAGTKGKADRLVATLAGRKGATVVTNDSFKELQTEFPWLLDHDRVLGASNPGGEWIFLVRQPVRPRKPDVNGR